MTLGEIKDINNSSPIQIKIGIARRLHEPASPFTVVLRVFYVNIPRWWTVQIYDKPLRFTKPRLRTRRDRTVMRPLSPPLGCSPISLYWPDNDGQRCSAHADQVPAESVGASVENRPIHHRVAVLESFVFFQVPCRHTCEHVA